MSIMQHLIIVLICISPTTFKVEDLVRIIGQLYVFWEETIHIFWLFFFSIVGFLLIVGVFDTVYWTTKSESIMCYKYLLTVSVACHCTLWCLLCSFTHIWLTLFALFSFPYLKNRDIFSIFLSKSFNVFFNFYTWIQFFFLLFCQPGYLRSCWDQSMFSPLTFLFQISILFF